MFAETDLLPLSGLQHLLFCERQCALIHIEQLWSENRLTAEGRLLHQKADERDAGETRPGVRIVRGLPLRSLRLGLSGRADVVEFHRIASEAPSPDESAAGERWIPFPIEYKRGRPKPDRCDEVQLCAQALCLEEMLGVAVPRGAIFYGKPRRRKEIAFDASLRSETEAAAARLHELIASGRTPPAVYEKKCESCSLIGLCLPKATEGRRSAAGYLERALGKIAG